MVTERSTDKLTAVQTSQLADWTIHGQHMHSYKHITNREVKAYEKMIK